jgi:hypothetical protein
VIQVQIQSGFTDQWNNFSMNGVKKTDKVERFIESSNIWEEIEQCCIREIGFESRTYKEECDACGIRFTYEHIGKLYKDLSTSNLLNIITTSTNGGTLSKLRIRQALEYHENSLFISLLTLINMSMEKIQQIWPCKWSSVLVVDCEQCYGHVSRDLEDIITLLKTSGKKIVISQCNHQNLNPKIQATHRECYTRLEEKLMLEHLTSLLGYKRHPGYGVSRQAVRGATEYIYKKKQDGSPATQIFLPDRAGERPPRAKRPNNSRCPHSHGSFTNLIPQQTSCHRRKKSS